MALKSLDDASAKEMREYAELSMGLPNITPTMNKATVLQKMAEAGFDGDMIEVEEVDPETAVPPLTRDEAMKVISPDTQGHTYDGDPDNKPDGLRWVQEILVPADPNKTRQIDQFVGVNGKNYLIKRGVEVVVPIEVVEAMKNAVAYQYQPLDASTPLHEMDGLGPKSAVPSVVFSTLKPPYLAKDPTYQAAA